jgi:L-ascorbate metabolism protein UlaG (beta-lactamase superfamily)
VIEVRFHGHACFELLDGDATVLVDPFLAPENPVAKASADDVEPTHLLLTHGHGDHVGEAVAIAKRTGAPVVAIVELARWLASQGVEETHDPNLGGTVGFDWGWVKLVPAFHTNTAPDGTAIGPAAGLVIRIGERTVYHLGDTALFGDLELVAERTPIDIALVPIGGHFTMDRHDAAVACEMLDAPTVIPCHYDTFGKVEADAEAFKSDVEQRTDSEVVILAPGEAWSP